MRHRLPWPLLCLSVLALAAVWPCGLRAEDTPPTSADLLKQAAGAAAEGDSAQAVQLATRAIQSNPDEAAAYYTRGRAHFQLGQIRQSVADFDQLVRLRPDLESRQWERGIAYYYAGQFQKGARQFELYQSFHDNDVENSVWRYLCMVPSVGVERARAAMLPIKNDPRVPMMQIYDLYRGKLQPKDVLAAVNVGDPVAELLRGRMFYARLYLGLYYQANGKQDLARKYILAAADKHKTDTRINRYMWSVADVHARRLRAAVAERGRTDRDK